MLICLIVKSMWKHLCTCLRHAMPLGAQTQRTEVQQTEARWTKTQRPRGWRLRGWRLEGLVIGSTDRGSADVGSVGTTNAAQWNDHGILNKCTHHACMGKMIIFSDRHVVNSIYRPITDINYNVEDSEL